MACGGAGVVWRFALTAPAAAADRARETPAGEAESPVDEPRLREPAPKQRDVASTARAAIDAMRRGVIEYMTLTD